MVKGPDHCILDFWVGSGHQIPSGNILQAALDWRVADKGSLKETVSGFGISPLRTEMKSLQRGGRTREVRHQEPRAGFEGGVRVQCRHILLRGLEN